MKNVSVFLNSMERNYVLSKTLFVNKVSSSFKFFSNVTLDLILFDQIVYSILVEN